MLVLQNVTAVRLTKNGHCEQPRTSDPVEIGSLVFRCPMTRANIDSGVDLDLRTFERLKGYTIRVRCDQCADVHDISIWRGSLVPFKRTAPTRCGETRPILRGRQPSGVRTSPEPRERFPMGMQLSSHARVDIHVKDRLAAEFRKRIVKLRWMGLDEEAERLRHVLHSMRLNDVLLADPRDTD